MLGENFPELFQEILNTPLKSASIIINLIIIESLLSIDNAAVLATMVLHLSKDERRKALKYGILGAYFFRGICLLFAALLMQVWWFKPLGGIYLLFIGLKHLLSGGHEKEIAEQELAKEEKSPFFKKIRKVIGPFWTTVIMVELMDLAFSIDNVIAANAYTKNIILVWAGVFIGILAMRFVAQGFVRLMERYPSLSTSAYIVITLLGIKLSLSLFTHFYPCSGFTIFMEGPNECFISRNEPIPEGHHPTVWGDLLMSSLSILIFLAPIVFSWFKKDRRRAA